MDKFAKEFCEDDLDDQIMSQALDTYCIDSEVWDNINDMDLSQIGNMHSMPKNASGLNEL